MNIYLCAVDSRLARAWRQALPQEFGPAAVQVIEGDILSLPVDAVVSPANSFALWMAGWMRCTRAFSARSFRSGFSA